jgi:hypothetical protein
MTDPAPQPASSKRKLLIGGGVAVVAAAAIVTLFVLPAEYGIDPTGVGKATGVLKIAEPGPSMELQRGMKRTGVLTPSATPLPPEPGASDRFEITLAPFAAIELKYEIAQGQPMVFHWQASAPVHVDMHAHPFEGGTALTESYLIDDAIQQQSARYVAPFTGIHGWYWQNRTLEDVTVTLEASGKLIGSRTFDQFGEHPRALTGPAAAPE